jgi:uncharacterized protein involved in outer membrane biogenesis
MLAVGKLSLSGPLLANLLGDFTISEVLSEDVSVMFQKNSKGESNWDFNEASAAEETKVEQESGPIVIPSVKKLSFKNVSVELLQEGNKRNLHFKTIAASNINFEEAGTLSSSLEIDSVPINLEGGLSSITKFLNGDPLKFNVDLKHGENHLRAKGRLHNNAKSYLEVTSSGEDLASLTELVHTELPPYGKYSLSAKVSKTHDGGSESITIDELLVQLGESQISGKAILNLLDNGDLKAEVDLTSQSNTISTKGIYKSNGNADFDISASGGLLSELSALALNDLPSWQDYEIKGKLLSGPDNKIDVEKFALRIGDNDLEGDISAILSPLSLKAKLNSTTFDIGALTASPEQQTDKAQNSDEEIRIPYEVFESLDLDVSLTAANLTAAPDVKLNDASITAVIKNGVLDIPTFSGKIFGGSFKSNIRLAKEGLKLVFDGSKFAAGSIVKLAGAEPFLSGDFNFAVDLQGQGEVIPDILKSLSGTIELNSDHAELKNSGLQTVSSGLSDILAPLLKDSKEADSECLIFNYKVENGIASSDIQVVKLKRVFIFAKGELDFPNNSLEYNFHVQSTSPSLASLIPPFRSFGKLNSPYFVPSVSGTVASVADSGEAVVGTVTGIAKGATSFVLGNTEEKLSGVAVCKKAYEVEQKLLSSRVGNLLKPKKTSTKPEAANGAINDETQKTESE